MVNITPEREEQPMTKRAPRPGTVKVFQPVGVDLWDARPHTPAAGTLVKVVKAPNGCPPNGTMGHCYIGDATTGAFIGLVLVNSLTDR
jgi:hypothetical protein